MAIKTPFAATKECSEFMQELLQTLVNEIGKVTTRLIAKDNIQILYHGMNWSFQREDRMGFSNQTSQLEKQQTTVHIEVERIRDYDLLVLPEFIERTVKDYDEQLHRRLFSTIDEVTQETGNVVAISKGTSLAKATLDALENLQFGVGFDGEVALPSVFLNPESYKQVLQEIAQNPSAHAEATHAIIEKKKMEAVQREQARLSKYETSCEPSA